MNVWNTLTRADPMQDIVRCSLLNDKVLFQLQQNQFRSNGFFL